MHPRALFLTVCAGTAFGSACAYTLNLVFQITVVGLDPLRLVLVGTVLETVYLLAQVPMGLVADHRGRRLPVLLGVFLTGGGTVLQGAAPTFAATLAGTALWGVGAACFDGAFEAWAADELGEDAVGAALTRGAQLAQASAVAGMLAATGLATVLPALPLLAGGTVWLVLGVVLLTAMRSTYRGPAGRPAWHLRAAFRSRRLRLVTWATLFVALGREGFDRLSTGHLLSLTPGDGTVWIGALAIATTLVSIPLTRLLRRARLSWTVAAQTAAMLAFALSGTLPAAAATATLAGALRAAADPLWTTWLVRETTPANRATVLSAVGMAGALGEITGGPPAGWLGTRFSVARALLACAVVTAPAVAFLAGLRAGRRARPTQR